MQINHILITVNKKVVLSQQQASGINAGVLILNSRPIVLKSAKRLERKKIPFTFAISI